METWGFEEFFAAEHARLHPALCAVTGSTQEAEEIMQAFLRLWERWERISSIEDPVGYLYRTAMNVFRQRLRRAKGAVRKVNLRRTAWSTGCLPWPSSSGWSGDGAATRGCRRSPERYDGVP